MPRQLILSLTSVSALLLIASPSRGLAEEIICDPENPACQIEDAPAEPSPDERVEGEEEVICDPENPACQAEEGPDKGAGAPVFVDPSDVSLPPPSNADFELRWGSSIALDTRWEGAEDIVEMGTSIDAGINLELDPTLSVVLQAQLRHWIAGQERDNGPNLLFNAARPRAEFEPRLGESYVAWRPGRFALRAGMLTTNWGKTRLVKPNQVINASDRRDFGQVGPARGDGVVPQLTAEVGWSAPRWSLTGVIVPFFEPDRVVLFGRDTALAGPRSPLATSFPLVSLLQQFIDPSVYDEAQSLVWSPARPDETPKSGSLGGRFAATFANTDVGLSYYWGWDRTPRVQIDEDAAKLLEIIASDEQLFVDYDFLAFFGRNPNIRPIADRLSEKAAAGEEVIVQEYERRHTLMVDVERYIGQVGVRADVAASPRQNFSTESLGTIRRPAISSALGLSYERLEGERIFAVMAEGFLIQPLSRTSGATEYFVEEERRGEEGEEAAIIGARLYGVAGGLTWDLPVVKTNVQVGGVYNISSRDLIANMALRRELREGLWINLGANLFEGPPVDEGLTLGGLFDVNDNAYLGLDGVF